MLLLSTSQCSRYKAWHSRDLWRLLYSFWSFLFKRWCKRLMLHCSCFSSLLNTLLGDSFNDRLSFFLYEEVSWWRGQWIERIIFLLLLLRWSGSFLTNFGFFFLLSLVALLLLLLLIQFWLTVDKWSWADSFLLWPNLILVLHLVRLILTSVVVSVMVDRFGAIR
jgi:hypothetical protein